VITNSEVFANHRVLASLAGVDETRSLLSDLYRLPIELVATTPSKTLDMRINAVQVGRIVAGYLRFGEAVRIVTSETADFYLDVPLGGSAFMRPGNEAGVHCTPRQAAIFGPARVVVAECDETYEQLTLTIPAHDLHRELEQLVGRTLSERVEFSTAMDLTTPAGRAFTQTLRLLDHVSMNESGALEHPLAARRLEEVILHCLLLGQAHNHTAALQAPPATIDRRPVAEAVELLRSQPEYPWTGAELSGRVGVSIRSLQEGFRKAVGVAPMAYLRQRRLERVHDELIDGEPGIAQVTEIAGRWGFTHLGHFGVAYKTRFHERPSDTLRSSARVGSGAARQSMTPGAASGSPRRDVSGQ
jgi:AraC-like DNA-binding protein